MKKLWLCIILLNSIFKISSAQTPVKLWESFFNGALTGNDESNFVLADSSGNVFVTGISYQTFIGGDFTTVKYDANGFQLWADHFTNTQASCKNYGKKLVMDKWQNVYAVGTTALNDGDLAVCKYNGTGRIWCKNYEPYWFSTYDDYGIDMDVDSSGNFYAIARVNSPNGNLYDMYLIKCDSSGTKTWDINYSGGSDDDYPVAVRTSPAGTAYTLLQSFNFFGTASQDITTLQILGNGTQNWFSKYDGPGNGNDYPASFKIDAAENQYICGTADAGATNDMVAMKQNNYGTRLWVATYNGTANGNDTAIAVTWLPNGLVAVTGLCKELHNNTILDAFVTMVIDSGTIVWTQKFYGTDSLGAAPTQMITDVQGNIYICGFENLFGGTKNGCIIKYDSNGNLLWNISYDSGLNLNDKFNSIALDNNNDIIVTGQTYTTSTNANYLTVKYGNSATGINENKHIENINIFPNPAHTTATIICNLTQTREISISITDMLGREVKKISSINFEPNSKISLDISELNNGIYLVRINGSTVLVRKLIVEK